MQIKEEIFGTTSAGEEVKKITLVNDRQVAVSVLSYGATWYDWQYQKEGQWHSMVSHLDSVAEYESNPFHLGNTIGRVAGRIANARFHLEGKDYQLPANERRHLLHSSSINGFDTYNWQAVAQQRDNDASVQLTMETKEDGFPGQMQCRVTYTLNNENEVLISYEGISDQTTLFNPMTHVYFTFGDTLDGVKLTLNGDWIKVDDEKIPTGEWTPVHFQSQEVKDLLKEWPQNQLDDAFRIPSQQYAVELEKDGVHLLAKTDRNAAVLFTADPFCLSYKESRPFNAIAVELQTLPDAIHHSNFGNILLPKGEKRCYQNVYRLEFDR